MLRLRCVAAFPLIAVAFLAARAWAADVPAAPGLTRSSLRVSTSESVFANANQSDAAASRKVWSDQLGKLRGFQLDARLQAGDLDPVRDLWKEYHHLPGAAQAPVRAAVPPADQGLPDGGKGRN
jgi:streptogramin lyase